MSCFGKSIQTPGGKRGPSQPRQLFKYVVTVKQTRSRVSLGGEQAESAAAGSAGGMPGSHPRLVSLRAAKPPRGFLFLSFCLADCKGSAQLPGVGPGYLGHPCEAGGHNEGHLQIRDLLDGHLVAWLNVPGHEVALNRCVQATALSPKLSVNTPEPGSSSPSQVLQTKWKLVEGLLHVLTQHSPGCELGLSSTRGQEPEQPHRWSLLKNGLCSWRSSWDDPPAWDQPSPNGYSSCATQLFLCLCSTRTTGPVPGTGLDTRDTTACRDQEGEAWIGRSMLRSATLADRAELCLHPTGEPSLCKVQRDLESKAPQRSTEQSVPAEHSFEIAW